MSNKPYPGLNPYSEEDAKRFFGRSDQIQDIIQRLKASRLTILYGESGVGKTSVVRAGVAAQLCQQAQENLARYKVPVHAVVVFPPFNHSWKDEPIPQLKRQIEQTIQELAPNIEPPEPELPFIKTLQVWTERLGGAEGDGELFIILDQFEEYFLYHRSSEPEEGTFAFEFPSAVIRSRLRVNFLISMRKDSLAELDYFKGRLLNLLSNTLELGHLDWNSAREAIQQPIDQYYNQEVSPEAPFTIEEQLIDQVLEEVSLRNNHQGRIEAPYLQLVMERLWKKESDASFRCLRFQTLMELGGAEGITDRHLKERMELLSKNERDIEIAANVFHYLVTPSGSKQAYSAFDLAALANRAQHDRDGTELVTEEDLNLWLDKLTQKDFRLLRPVGKSPHISYEIFHDVLAKPILAWLAQYLKEKEEESAKQKAEQIKQEAEKIAQQKIEVAQQEAKQKIEVAQLEAQQKIKSGWQKARWLTLAGIIIAMSFTLGGIFIAWEKQKAILAQSDASEARADFREYINWNKKGSIDYMNVDTLSDILRAGNGLQKSQNDWLQKKFIGEKQYQEQVDKLTNILKPALNPSIQELNQLALQIKDPEVSLTNVSFSFSEGTTQFAVVLKDDGIIRLGNFQVQKLGEPIAVKKPVTISLNSDGTQLAAVLEDGTISLWDIKDTEAKRLKTLSGHNKPIRSINFIKNGTQLIILFQDGTIGLRELDGKSTQLGEIPPINPEELVSFSSDGTQIAIASEDGTIYLRKLRESSSQAKVIHQGNKENKSKNRITSLSFAPNGTQLAATSENFVNLWDTGKFNQNTPPMSFPISVPVNSPDEEPKKILNASFVFGGLQFAAALEDGTISLWNFQRRSPSNDLEQMDLENLLERGCDQLSDYLQTHPDERKGLPMSCFRT